MYPSYTENLTAGRLGISIAHKHSVGATWFQPESIAAGGAEFQHHRQLRTPAYVANALPTETGLQSIDWQDVPAGEYSNEARGVLEYANGCCADSQLPMQFKRTDIVDLINIPLGSLLLRRDGSLHLFHNGTCVRREMPKGVDLSNCNLEGMGRFRGRAVLFTCSTLYLAGTEDPFDFTPSLRTTGQSMSLTFDIGKIITLIPFSDGLYVLGSRGGALGVCSGDSDFPIQFQQVQNFNGLYHRENVRTDFYADELLAYTRTGLQKIVADKAFNVFPEISTDLLERRLVNLDVLKESTEQADYANHLGLETVTDHEHRDDYPCPTPDTSTLYSEHTGVADTVMVNNCTPRYRIISFGGLDEGVYGQRIYTRAAVLDTTLDRLTVLHVKHTDCIAKTDMDVFFATPNGVVEWRRDKGLAAIVLHNWTGTRRRALKINFLGLRGRINSEAYRQVKLPSGHCATTDDEALAVIPSTVGQDFPGYNPLNSLRLVTHSVHDVHYVGKIVGHTVSAVVPFSGHVVDLIRR